MNMQTLCAIGIGAVACATDLHGRRIPNWLTFGAAIAGVLYQGIAPGGDGVLTAVGGWVVGAAIFFVPFALRGLGAGDVKLLAAIGAWVGPAAALWTALYAGIAGGILAVLVSFYSGYLTQALRNIWFLLQHWTVVGIRPVHEISLEGSKGPRLAYAVPILAGLVAALWLR